MLALLRSTTFPAGFMLIVAANPVHAGLKVTRSTTQDILAKLLATRGQKVT